jgi:hypothetical protein
VPRSCEGVNARGGRTGEREEKDDQVFVLTSYLLGVEIDINIIVYL